MQNDFLSPKGFFAQNQWDITLLRKTVPVIRHLKEALPRETLVVYTATGYEPHGDDNVAKLHSIIPKQLTEGGNPRNTPILIRGSWGNRIVEELTPQERDYVVVKRRYDAFYGTDLEMILKTHGIRTILFTGVVTEVCVETTLREAFVRDFDIVLVEDGCGSWDVNRHTATCQAVEFAFGAVLSSSAVIEKLRHPST